MSKSNRGNQSIVIGTLLVLVSTLGFSVYPILGKFIFAGGAGLLTVLFVRFTIASLFFWTLTLYREGFPRLTLKLWLVLWGLGGICYSLMAALYLSSVRFIPTSLAALLLYAYPVIVTVMAVMTKQEKFSSYKIVGLFLSTTGLVLVLGLALKGVNFFGVSLALGAAFVYAIYIIIGNQVLKSTTPLVSTALISSSAALTYGIVGLIKGGNTFNLSFPTWSGIVGIALFSTIIAMLTFFQGMKYIGATSASIISTLEPVMTVILAIFLLHEGITLLQVLGGFFVIMGGILAILPPTSKVIDKETTCPNV